MTNQISPQDLNQLQRNAVLAQAIEMTQNISTQTINPANTPSVTIAPRPVGLLKKFIVVVKGTISNTDAALDATLTDFGLANLLSNVQFTDLQNNQRINTTGWHLSFLNSIKRQGPYASGFLVETDTMGGFGENFAILSAPATIAHGTTATVRGVYEIPITYSDEDLRGGIMANVVNATMQISLTPNPRAFAAAGTDSTLAVYKGTASCAFTSITFEVYQVYLDQLPIGQGGIVTPLLDMATVYELKTSPFAAIPAGQDYPVPYANFRDFLSTFAIYNHDVTGDTGRVGGTDLNYMALQSANFTNIWKKTPLVQAQDTRTILGCDLPKGTYYMSSRRKPISSIQFGNMELVFNPITGGPNAQLLIGWEDFAYTNTLSTAGSLA